MIINYLLNIISSICFLLILPVTFLTDYGIEWAIFATIFLALTNSYTNNR